MHLDGIIMTTANKNHGIRKKNLSGIVSVTLILIANSASPHSSWRIHKRKTMIFISVKRLRVCTSSIPEADDCFSPQCHLPVALCSVVFLLSVVRTTFYAQGFAHAHGGVNTFTLAKCLNHAAARFCSSSWASKRTQALSYSYLSSQ